MKFIISLLLASLLLITANAQNSPATYMWNGKHLATVKQEIAMQNPTYTDAYHALVTAADRALNLKNPTVMDKPMTAASGDRHDYLSMGRYFWPNPNTPDGLPYITRDGESNPELYKYDRNRLGAMADAVVNLSLAYYLGGDQKYADKAVDMLRTWFIDTATLMNPNANFAQMVPGVNNGKGRSYGIIDTYSFVNMLDGVMLLDSKKAIPKSDLKALRKWFAEYSKWLVESENGRDEAHTTNNHSIAYDVQLAFFAAFAGEKERAGKTFEEFPRKRLFAQIEPDGSQPEELRRTIAMWYSVYNLLHIMEFCDIARYQGVDIFSARSDDGRSICGAIDFLTPYLGTNGAGFPYQQISNWSGSEDVLLQVLYRAAKYDNTKGYEELYRKYAPKREPYLFVLLHK